MLRHVSTAFTEDPVRILRVARFAARFSHLGFRLAAETLALMQEMVKHGEVNNLVPERVWKETERALGEPNPEVFFETLRACYALEKIFPELDCLWGIPQTAKWHPEIDTGKHIMLALKKAVQLSSNIKVRFAVVCHDLGKGLTPRSILPSHHGHEARGVPLVQQLCKKYKVPNDYKNLALKVTRWHLHAHRALELNAKTILQLFKSLDVFRNPEILQDFLLACQADSQGRLGKEDAPYLQAKFLASAYMCASRVQVKPLLESGLSGRKLGVALDNSRIDSIKKFKQDFLGENNLSVT